MRIIYDVGANNGDDLPYYLKKADRVVAVEANPLLCRAIEKRFAVALQDGRLVVENCVLLAGKFTGPQPFYIHKSQHVLSQFPRPDDQKVHEFECTYLPARSVTDIIREHGSPYYVKVDVEGYDRQVLKALFDEGIFPPYISAEAHSAEVFTSLVALGGYRAFKLVNGATIPKKYNAHEIKTHGSVEKYSFPFHSAGPFGEDIDGDWLNVDNFFRLLAFEGLGWKDVHATSECAPNPELAPRFSHYFTDALRRRMGNALLKAVPILSPDALERCMGTMGSRY